VLPSGEHAKNAHSIILPSLRQHYLVAMAISLDKLETKVQIHHRHKALSYGEKIAKIGPVHPEIFDEICQTTTWTRNAISIRLFSAETTGPIFTRILHDIVALVALLNHAYTRRYPIPFLNARLTKVRSLSFFSQNRLLWQRLLIYRKKRSRSIICTQNAVIRWKDCENLCSGSSDNLSLRRH